MYRHFIWYSKLPVYCPDWPCDRQCGLLHMPLLKLHTPVGKKTAPIVEIGDEADSGRPSTTDMSTDFEAIMNRAGKKVSVSYEEPPMPPPLQIPETPGRDTAQASPHVDTTILFFESGRDTTRSDDIATLYGDPPTTLDNESTIDDLMNRNSHDIAMNPIFHDRIDSRIDSDDEFDFSDIDGLPPMKLEHQDSLDSMTPSLSSQIAKAKKWRRTHYEPSLDIL